jgi:thioredoxin reductase (NADPH)
VRLSDGSEISARAVILAMGAAYRRLEIPGLERLVGAGVYYGAVGSETLAVKGREVFVVGGANAAGQAALHLARYAHRVTLLVRGASLAPGMSEYLVQEIEARENLQVRVNTRVVGGGGEDHLETLVVEDRASGQAETFPAAGLFVMIGAKPHTDWLPPSIRRDPAGYIWTGQHAGGRTAPQEPRPQEEWALDSWPLQRPPFLLETSLPGVFAAGDVRHGSVKRVASAVGEGAMAVQLLHQYFMV